MVTVHPHPGILDLMDQNLHLQFQDVKKRLADQLDRRESTGSVLQATFQIIRDFEQLGGLLYRLRRQLRPDDPRLVAAEDYLALASAQLMSEIKQRRGSKYAHWVARYRRIWRQNTDLFLITTCIFLVTGVVGWNIGATMPEYAATLIPQEFMERIIQHNKWFESLNDSPVLGGAQIAYHNIKVCLITFLAGAILGLGGLFLIGFNGLFFGVVLGFCYANQFDQPLKEFVTGHGPLELSIIVCAGFASSLYGRVFWMRPYSQFGTRMKEGMREAGTVATGVIPWLLLAGMVEGTISPDPLIPLKVKILIGTLIAMLFWFWTWAPFTPLAALEEAEKAS